MSFQIGFQPKIAKTFNTFERLVAMDAHEVQLKAVKCGQTLALSAFHVKLAVVNWTKVLAFAILFGLLSLGFGSSGQKLVSSVLCL